MKTKNGVIALICTPGGHFEQLENLSDFYNNYQHFWITMKHPQTEYGLRDEKKYYINHAHFKKPWTYINQIPKLVKIFLKERPSFIVSTGSGRASFAPFLLAKLLKIQFIYIDSFSRVNNPTLFANFLAQIGHPFFVQWDNNSKKNAIFIGPVFKEYNSNNEKKSTENHVLVTLGSRLEPFERMIKAVEHLVEKKVINNKVKVQAGYTMYESVSLDIFDFCSVDELDDLILNAKYIITQESAGIATKCLKLKKRFLVMPRDYKFGEVPSKSDMKEDLYLKLEQLGYTIAVHNVDELESAIKHIDQLKTGYKFDNRLAISKLSALVGTYDNNTIG